MGLLIALLSGIFTTGMSLMLNMTLKQILFMAVINLSKDGMLYLTNHPMDEIDTVPPFKSGELDVVNTQTKG